jgi:hypothetical protein
VSLTASSVANALLSSPVLKEVINCFTSPKSLPAIISSYVPSDLLPPKSIPTVVKTPLPKLSNLLKFS